MIQEMSLDLVGERFAVFAPPPSADDMKLAAALAEDAARHAGEAGKQREYAEMARGLIMETANEENRGELVGIAVWHYERCAVGFRRAVVGLESAAKIQKAADARRRLLKRAGAFAESAAGADLAARELKQGEKMKKGGLNNETG